MARKYDFIKTLYQQICKEVAHSPQNWQDFLSSACNYCYLRFDEQLLVYAQKPTATAVLEFEKWNRNFNRRINRGSKGIAIFTDINMTKIDYYFDVSDTSPREYSRPVNIWQYKEEYQDNVIQTLENFFGSLENKNDLPNAVFSAVNNYVNNNLSDNLKQLSLYKEDSFLEEFDDDIISSILNNTIKNSAAFMIMSRLGLKADEFIFDDDFREILNFNTSKTLNILGSATSDIASMALTELAKTINSLEKGNRTFAEKEKSDYTDSENKNERNVDNDRTRLHTSWRRTSPQSDTSKSEEFDFREIFADEEEFPQGELQRSIHQSADELRTRRTSLGNRTESERDGRTVDVENGSTRGTDRGTQSERSNGVGTGNEQPKTESTGNRFKRSDLYALNPDLPPLLDKNLIFGLLANKADDLKVSKEVIVDFFEKTADENKRDEFIKSIYPDIYKEIDVNNVRLSYQPQEHGLQVMRGAFLSRTEEALFSWQLVSGIISELIKSGEYLPTEKDTSKEKPSNTNEAQITDDLTVDVEEYSPTSEISLIEETQLSFFSLMNNQIEQDDSSPQEVQTFFPSVFALSQQVIDEALCSGANENDSRLEICAYFRRDYGVANNAEFLKTLYNKGAFGFIFEGEQISVFYDEKGMKISKGNYANRSGATLISWEQAAKRVRELLDNGRYMPQTELDQVDSFELKNIADRLVEFERNIREDYEGKEKIFPFIRNKLKNTFGYPDRVEKVKELLSNPAYFGLIRSEYDNFMNAIKYDGYILRNRYRRQYTPEYTYESIKGMSREPIIFKAQDGFATPSEYFITYDEIKALIRGGESKYDSEHRLEKYSYYLAHSATKDRVNYLKSNASWSGYGNGFIHYQQNGKGFTYSQSDVFRPYAKTKLSWEEVNKYISKMIANHEYLSQNDLALVDYFERKKAATAIHHFYFGVPKDTAKLSVHSDDYWGSIEDIAVQLTNPDRVSEIQSSMTDLYETVIFEERYREYADTGIKTINEFANNKFTCFGDKRKTIAPLIKIEKPAEKEYDDAFFINAEKQSVVWIYYNPDSVSGGQYVTNNLSFDDIISAAESYKEPKAFFNYLGEICHQELADIGTEFFEPTKAEFYSKPDFVNCTEQTMQAIISKAKDEIEPKQPQWFKEYNRLKSKYPNALAFYQVGDFYEAYSDDAKTVANELDLIITSRHISDTERIARCGFPNHNLDTNMERLNKFGYSAVISTLENGVRKDKLYPYPPLDNDSKLQEAKDIINQFVKDEYLNDDGADFTDLTNVNVAYTNLGDNEEHEVQVSVDLINFSVNKYYDGRLAESSQYESIDDLITSELEGMSFDDLVYIEEDKINKLSVPIEQKSNDKISVEELATEADHTDIIANESELSPPQFYPKSRVQTFDLHPEIPMSERHTYNFAEKEIETVGKKERFRRNIAAIKVLKECEFENRFATPEEQEILSQYVGWGGISEAFDETNQAWADEFKTLYDTLSPAEYESAKASTLTAFYTPQTVISAIYKAMDNLGFKQGNILEPCCAIGNFIGMLPENMQESKMYGIEIDSVSAGIAQQLYQKSSIMAQPFEEADLPDSFFDAVVGNVPFGDHSLADKRYDKHHFLIHDYFFAKSLDKLRPGGVMCLITSQGTMDKENSNFRRYLAQRADLLGAIRLPYNAFKGNGGTEITSDILILQKRDRIIDIEPEWVYLDTNSDGIRMNKYFISHPEMILGNMIMQSGRFGPESACKPFEGASLNELLNEAIKHIHGEITDRSFDDELAEQRTEYIQADPTVRNFSYTIVDGKIYYRENSVMRLIETTETGSNRIKGMIGIRDSVRNLIELQKEDYPDYEIKKEQENLNTLFDKFVKKYGYLNDRANALAFKEDSSYYLICSLEKFKEGKFVSKADVFNKRTIQPHIAKTHADTSIEAYGISLGEKATVDMPFMCQLTGKIEEEIVSDLQGVIFLNPDYGIENGSESKYLPAEEYLSGNVREKLQQAKELAEKDERFQINVEALSKVQPIDLKASEIDVRLGATWLPIDVIAQFMYDTFKTPFYTKEKIRVQYSESSDQWNISNKSADNANSNVTNKYGTRRKNAYTILESTLNLKDVRVFDYKIDDNGNRVAVLNKKETAIAQAKQELIKQSFKDWIWKDIGRRERLCKIYNEKFNCLRPREYDGSHIVFEGMNPEITLNPHQKNGVARAIYGGNTLLAHCVGAGKTYTMIAIAQETKRLGLCNKSLFVVPNHLISQWASEYLTLYPAANILVSTAKDFEAANRKKFCGKIATGDYDAVIIGQSQFEKIPVSIGRQIYTITQQIREVVRGISDLKANNGEKFSVKALEATKKKLETKLKRLSDQSQKDDVVTFEELGIDRLFVDEAHYYKNLFVYSKMRNVGGIAQTEAKKSSDLFMKCQYLDEHTNNRGIIFATGTPISNSMVELYTMQRYLQYDLLRNFGLISFDSWAANYGETVNTIELTPEGTGYHSKTRFSRFYNLPELMSMFKLFADVKTADVLDLPVPKAEYHNISVKPSEIQKELVEQLGKRAEKIRNGDVKPYIDNMLLITNDGRKLALEQRLIDPLFPDFENSKVNVCVENIFKIWQNTERDKSAQLVFCDLSTPTNNTIEMEVVDGVAQMAGFQNVYQDIRNKLISRGIPDNEIAFIHEADNDKKKSELFSNVRSGKVRVLLGSTQKMGAGTNVQDRLIAIHNIDCPWRPSDLEQRAGRIIRQGNNNPIAHIYRYVTENTFDAYLYQLVEGKQKFIGQIMTSKAPVRSAEDVDEAALSYAEIKMLATGNPYIKEKMDLDLQVRKLKMLESNFYSDKYDLEDKVAKEYPREIAKLNVVIEALKTDLEIAKKHPKEVNGYHIGMTIFGKTYPDRKEAGEALKEIMKSIKSKNETIPIGKYRGFDAEVGMKLEFGSSNNFVFYIKGKMTYQAELGADAVGNIVRIDNVIDNFDAALEKAENKLAETKWQLETAKETLKETFPHADELEQKQARLNELNALLNINQKDDNFIDEEPDEEDLSRPKRETTMYR